MLNCLSRGEEDIETQLYSGPQRKYYTVSALVRVQGRRMELGAIPAGYLGIQFDLQHSSKIG